MPSSVSNDPTLLRPGESHYRYLNRMVGYYEQAGEVAMAGLCRQALVAQYDRAWDEQQRQYGPAMARAHSMTIGGVLTTAADWAFKKPQEGVAYALTLGGNNEDLAQVRIALTGLDRHAAGYENLNGPGSFRYYDPGMDPTRTTTRIMTDPWTWVGAYGMMAPGAGPSAMNLVDDAVAGGWREAGNLGMTLDPTVIQRTNGQLVQDIAIRAEAWGTRQGLGNGLLAGNLKHGYANSLLTRYQEMFGSRGLSTEVPYVNGNPWRQGNPLTGSIRLDVVEGPLNKPNMGLGLQVWTGSVDPSPHQPDSRRRRTWTERACRPGKAINADQNSTFDEEATDGNCRVLRNGVSRLETHRRESA